MKKILSLILVFILSFGVCCVATAANEDIVLGLTTTKNEVKKGDTFKISVDLKSNKGFVTLGLDVAYDSSVLEIVCSDHEDGYACYPVINKLGAVNGITNFGLNSQYHTANPYVMQWAYGLATKDVTVTGSVATLEFKVKDSAKLGKTEISLYTSQGKNAVGKKITSVAAKSVISVKIGDVDGNSSIDLKDLVKLAQRVAKWDIKGFVVSESDLNADGKTNLEDVTLLAQFVAGWEIQQNNTMFNIKGS